MHDRRIYILKKIYETSLKNVGGKGDEQVKLRTSGICRAEGKRNCKEL